MTTFNKLSYLKEVVKRLLSNIGKDEEIVIVDGSSTDGTKEYLAQLYREGKIHQFLSEPDKGEAHGTNKGTLLAKGELIKIVTDDDDFYFPGIQTCKEFMLNHPEFDMLSTDGLMIKWTRLDNPSRKANHESLYKKYKENHIPFDFCGLGWIIRRNSLPLLGLFNPNFIRMDAEFSLRITSSQASLAWYTGKTWAHIMNPGSNYITQKRKIEADTLKLQRIYPDLKPSFITRLRARLTRIKKRAMVAEQKQLRNVIPNVKLVFEQVDKWLEEINQKETGRFIS